MPVQVSYPGVYVQEIPSGVRTITGVSTSTALLVGMADEGPMDTPVRVLSYADVERKFGATNTSGELHLQARQFFQNGGSTAWIVRIANGALPAKVEIENEAGVDVLRLQAYSPGVVGSSIRATVDYGTAEPEATFNLTVEQMGTDSGGAAVVLATESYSNVDMNPSSGKYIIDVLAQQSNLVRAEDIGPAADAAYSLWGVYETAALNAVNVLEGTFSSGKGRFRISVDGSPFVTVLLDDTLITTPTDVQTAINSALNAVGKSVTVDHLPVGVSRWLWRITSDATGGLVTFAPSGTDDDICVTMQMGTAHGGIDVGGHAARRPVPNGIFGHLRVDDAAVLDDILDDILGLTASSITGITITDIQGTDPSGVIAVPSATPTSLLTGRAALDDIAAAINANLLRWTAVRHGYRLILSPNFGGASTDGTAWAATAGSTALNGTYFWDNTVGNVRNFQLGDYGTAQGSFHDGTAAGSNGTTPQLSHYEAAFDIVARDVDLFNMLLLPRAGTQGDSDRASLWGPASAFAKNERAILIVDPPAAWTTADEATHASTGVSSMRVGVVTDHATIHWPRIKVATDSSTQTIDPCGTMAGIMARIDGTRGVWKAPAGTEATMIGVRGVEYGMSDAENGIINPQALNAIRAFPNGIVSWGGRTMVGFDNSGNDDYKYLPVRRLALFIEESLFRGLQWAVFEPNDQPLWRQLRTAAGGFMNSLFRQGAFAGAKASEAYFVKVDSETTTQNDINLGIVNVVIGFAPLKPAEFVVIQLQQKAGEVQI